MIEKCRHHQVRRVIDGWYCCNPDCQEEFVPKARMKRKERG
jgi:hypothetical protein